MLLVKSCKVEGTGRLRKPFGDFSVIQPQHYWHREAMISQVHIKSDDKFSLFFAPPPPICMEEEPGETYELTSLASFFFTSSCDHMGAHRSDSRDCIEIICPCWYIAEIMNKILRFCDIPRLEFYIQP